MTLKDSADFYYKAKKFEKSKFFYSSCINLPDSKRQDLYFLSACYSKLGKIDSAYFFYSKALANGLKSNNLSNIDRDSNIIDLIKHKDWLLLKNHLIINSEKYLKIQNISLAKELDTRRILDQKYRNIQKIDSIIWEKQKKIDIDNQSWLDSIIMIYGWPTIPLVGEEGAKNAWLIVQHADTNLEFQKKCLAYMKNLIKTNDISLSNYAYLSDRILINQCKDQIYGTQFSILYDEYGKVKSIEFKPIEESKLVDKRRKYMNMISLEDYRKFALDRYK